MPSIFETERLLVRPWTLDDVEEAFAIYGDAEVSTFISWTGPEPSLEAQRESLARLIARHEGWDPGYGFWAIVETASGRIVGSVRLKPLPGHAEIDVGWDLGRRAWGHGYATEAGRGAIQYGFDRLGLSRIVAVVNPLNTRSLAVCRRLGMKHEGRIEAYSLELELFSITPAPDGVEVLGLVDGHIADAGASGDDLLDRQGRPDHPHALSGDAVAAGGALRRAGAGSGGARRRGGRHAA